MKTLTLISVLLLASPAFATPVASVDYSLSQFQMDLTFSGIPYVATWDYLTCSWSQGKNFADASDYGVYGSVSTHHGYNEIGSVYNYAFAFENLTSIDIRADYSLLIDLDTSKKGDNAKADGIMAFWLTNDWEGLDVDGIGFSSWISDGYNLDFAYNDTFRLDYDFGSPYSGNVYLGGMAGAWVDAYSEKKEKVPEPKYLFLIGILTLLVATRLKWSVFHS